MVKRALKSLLILSFTPFLFGCHHSSIQTHTGSMGHRTDELQQYVGGATNNKVEIRKNVIYLGKEYENNTFGPGKIRFVFDK